MRLLESSPLALLLLPAIPLAVLGIVELSAPRSAPPPPEHVNRCEAAPPTAPMPAPVPAPPTRIYIST